MHRNNNNTETQRQCFRCKAIFPLTEEFFPKDLKRLYGFNYSCIECERKRSKLRAKTGNKDVAKRKQKKYRSTRKGKLAEMWSSYRNYDRRKGYENNLTKEFIQENILGKTCVYCGFAETSIGCDRIDNTKGHTIDNIVPCCKICNISRMNNFSFEEMKKIGIVINEIKTNRLLSNIEPPDEDTLIRC